MGVSRRTAHGRALNVRVIKMSGDTRLELRRKALEVATEILASEGLNAIQARRIALASGCSVGTLYNLYAGLDELIIAVNAETLERLGARLEAVADQSRAANEDVRTALTRLAIAYFDFAQADRLSWQAVFQHQMPTGAFAPEWYRQRQARLFAIVEARLAGALADEGERQMASRALFSAVHGIVSLGLDEKLGPFDAPMVRRQIEFIVGAAVRGLS